MFCDDLAACRWRLLLALAALPEPYSTSANGFVHAAEHAVLSTAQAAANHGGVGS